MDLQDKRLFPLGAAKDLPTRPASFLIEPLVPAEGLTLLHGKFSTYKTPTALMMATAIATGRDLWGLRVNPTAPILYLQCDTPRDGFQPRVSAIAKHFGIDGGFTGLDIGFYYPGFDILGTEHKDRWQQLANAEIRKAHTERKYKLVVIDTFRTIHRLDDKLSETIHQVYSGLLTLFTGAAIILIHHDKKTQVHITKREVVSLDAFEGTRNETFSGSQAIINHAQSAIKLDWHSRRAEEIALRHSKCQVGELMSSTLVLKSVEDAEGKPIGVMVSATEMTVEKIRQAVKLKVITPDMKARQQDIAIASHFNVSERKARELRLEYERSLAQQPALTESNPGEPSQGPLQQPAPAPPESTASEPSQPVLLSHFVAPVTASVSVLGPRGGSRFGASEEVGGPWGGE